MQGRKKSTSRPTWGDTSSSPRHDRQWKQDQWNEIGACTDFAMILERSTHSHLPCSKEASGCRRRYVTLWPGPLTPWPWTFVVWSDVTSSKLCTKFERNETISGYWRFSYFQTLLLRWGKSICTKFGENSCTKCDISVMLLRFEMKAAQRRVVLKSEAKCHIFDPCVTTRNITADFFGPLCMSGSLKYYFLVTQPKCVLCSMVWNIGMWRVACGVCLHGAYSRHIIYNKMLSYRRETALQGAL